MIFNPISSVTVQALPDMVGVAREFSTAGVEGEAVLAETLGVGREFLTEALEGEDGWTVNCTMTANVTSRAPMNQ